MGEQKASALYTVISPSGVKYSQIPGADKNHALRACVMFCDMSEADAATLPRVLGPDDGVPAGWAFEIETDAE